MAIESIESRLADAAFGSSPGSWPLPTATTPRQLWLRAVAAGGQGRYGSAYTDLELLRRRVPAGRLASLAHSTQGSFLRQLGWHTLARGWDGRAMALAEADPEARADALIGLAADGLGVGRFAVSATLLTRADTVLDAAGLPADVANRLAVRRGWVAAELAMASGEAATAVDHAEEAVELARVMAGGSARHLVKSEVVLAAALCSAGAAERARGVGEEALVATGRLGLIPLRWALACLLIDIGSVTFSTRQLREIRDICADQVRRAGGTWRPA
ncbi:hypothetical protein [Mycobacterium ostraviense]|uniref:Uncharacterized protein n=1 Tax=Mycobacterium ostraviense TaxID=2738409 RepID=A0A164A393_9MYCO|nr:hypothetical protein [Mycobacterium ostraviense]KZS62058.1 hypothetical protein A4G28_18675 [Mycobacterium ostraviense]UGT90546.1 hypothetical protein LTS72_19945 [Mycobacterium ostraviense]